MGYSQEYAEGLFKQALIVDRLLHGWWISKSPVIRSLLEGKKKWDYTNRFEYNMLMSTGAGYGTVNGQVMDTFNQPLFEVDPTYGKFFAEYGQLMQSMTVDMLQTLETESKRSFLNASALKLFSLRRSITAGFKNFAIHGRFGVITQLRAEIPAPNSGVNPQPNTGFTPAPAAGTTLGPEFTIQVTNTAINTDLGVGTYVIKTQSAAETAASFKYAPNAYADCAELYKITGRGPYRLTLRAVGLTTSAWEDGDYLEAYGNRISENSPTIPNAGFDQNGIWQGTGTYSHGLNAMSGAFEGYADLFPWYTMPTAPERRLMLDMPFRNQANRQLFEFEQCGGWICQEDGEPIMDAIMRGVALSQASVDEDAQGVSINNDTLLAIGREEGVNNFRMVKEITSSQPYVFQRGIKEAVYQIGSRTLGTVVVDNNIPTDVVVVGPKLGTDMQYNCWDSTMSQIGEYIRDSYEPDAGPNPENLNWREIGELASRLDIEHRLIVGQPRTTDGAMPNGSFVGSQIIHPRNTVSVSLMEAGALFTEHPYAYTIVKLRHPIGNGGVVFQ